MVWFFKRCGRKSSRSLKWCLLVWNKKLNSRAGRSSPARARNNRTFQRNLLQGQGAFCYVNDPNLFVFVAVFKWRVGDMSVVLNTSNRAAEHGSAASRAVLETRGVCSGLHFKQQLFDALNGPGSPHQHREVGTAKGGHLRQGHHQGLKARQLLPQRSLQLLPKAQQTQKLPLPQLI